MSTGFCERSASRPGYRDGYTLRQLNTRLDTLRLRVPQHAAVIAPLDFRNLSSV